MGNRFCCFGDLRWFAAKPQTVFIRIQTEENILVKHIVQILLLMLLHCRSVCDALSSINTNGAFNLPKCPTRSIVNAFFVYLVHGDFLWSKGVVLNKRSELISEVE